MRAFASLRSLTVLQPDAWSVDALPGLAALPQLRMLDLSFEAIDDFEHDRFEEEGLDWNAVFDGRLIRASVLLPHLVHCSLTELTIEDAAFAEGDIASLCAAQPQLEKLVLAGVAANGLQGLSRLRSVLRTFELTLSRDRPSDVPTLFDEIRQMTALTSLSLHEISPPLAEKTISAIMPPSSMLPLLTQFASSPRR